MAEHVKRKTKPQGVLIEGTVNSIRVLSERQRRVGARRRWPSLKELHALAKQLDSGEIKGVQFTFMPPGTDPRETAPPGGSMTAIVTPAFKVDKLSGMGHKYTWRVTWMIWQDSGLHGPGMFPTGHQNWFGARDALMAGVRGELMRMLREPKKLPTRWSVEESVVVTVPIEGWGRYLRLLREDSTDPESLAIRKTAHLNPKRGQARLFTWKQGQKPHIKQPYANAVVALGIGRDVWWSPDVGVHAILYDELVLQGKMADKGMQGIHYFITYSGELLLS